MASTTQLIFVIFIFFSFFLSAAIDAQLSPSFYQKTCPKLQGIVRKTMAQAVNAEKRMGASILRLFFHDCFVNGCDGSILLVDTPTFTGEQGALPNKNSVRGFGVINTIKANVEKVCNATVSCADILALAARDGTVLLGGPSWTVSLGRRDSTTANLTAANTDLPPPFANLDTLISIFAANGLNATDMTALSGAHTIGLGRCVTFRAHIYNDTDIDKDFATLRKATCPFSGGDDNLAPIDLQTPTKFDNRYYQDLRHRRGLFHSDQELFNGGSQDELVKSYSNDDGLFDRDFTAAIIKMGNISPLTGSEGEIRLNCSVVNN
ncbi:hypothetical protein Nepgr_013972 [Nepenthes gracilis]|uniref:Peroxidase n=1 Tax=Nepenthes gracilis TaxID=150966 RepID=A0AAD3SKP6_NEPGR|nr:hypothetical protein Nepgr_013972 [Nepenthes gracilis]